MEATTSTFALAGSARSGVEPGCGHSRFTPRGNGGGGPTALAEAILQLPRSTDAPRLARSCVRRQGSEQLARSERELVEVLMTELVTNAVTHPAPESGGSVDVHFIVTADRVHVAVRDSGEGFGADALRRPRSEPGGYGLIMVDRGASRWGTSRDGGNCVWFELDRDVAA